MAFGGASRSRPADCPSGRSLAWDSGDAGETGPDPAAGTLRRVSEDTSPLADLGWRPRLAVLKALGDNTRYAIYLELAGRRAAGHGGDRRDPRPAPEHRAPSPGADARGRPAGRRDRCTGDRRTAAAPLLARRRRPVPGARARDLPRAGPHAAEAGGDGRPGQGEVVEAAEQGRARVTRRPGGTRRPADGVEGTSASAAGGPAGRPGFRSGRGRRRRAGHRRLHPLPVPRAGRGHPEVVCGLHRGLVEGSSTPLGGRGSSVPPH